MVKKLLKYELMATGRLYLPLYLVMLIFAVLGRLSLWRVPWHITAGEDVVGWTNFRVSVEAEGFLRELLSFLLTMVLLLYVLVVLGALVVHFIITLQRFWKNLMGDEGYLMFTLPVTPGELLWSKALSTFLWSLLTILMVILSVVILIWHPLLIERVLEQLASVPPEEKARIGQLLQALFPPLLWPILAVEMVLSSIGGTFLLYAAMAMGHTVHHHKVLASIGSYAAITMVIATASSFVIGGVTPFLTGGLPQLQLFSSTPEVLLFCQRLGDYILVVMGIALVLDLAATLGGYWLARYLLTTQVDLE